MSTGIPFFRKIQSELDLNGPTLSMQSQPAPTSTSSAEAYNGTITSLIQETHNGYPVRGYLYYPNSLGSPSNLDVVVLYHGTITSPNTSPADAATTFLQLALNRVNLKDKLIFSVAYPQDAIPIYVNNPDLAAQQFPGLNFSSLLIGDNIVYAEAALLWVKNNLGSYLSSNNIPKTVNKVYTFGHSQGAYLVHRLNTLHAVDGVISNAPGPIDLLSRCSGSQNTVNISCNKINVGFGTTGANPSAYNSRSLKNFLSGTLSPTLFTQALDDDTGDAYGSPQVANMKNIVQVGLSTCTNCAEHTFNYYGSGGTNNTGGGHDAFANNPFVQKDIRKFVGSVGAGIATFIGIGTAIYPPGQSGRKTNTGSITHQWHKVGVGALSDTPSGTITGSGTTTLTLSGLTSPTDNGSEYFCQIGYNPNSLSPNAVNEPFDSTSAALTVLPTISITTQPTDVTIIQGLDAQYSVNASVSDNSTNLLSYQWMLDGVDLSDGSTGDGTISGSRTSVLTISRSTPDLYRVACKVSHLTANPSVVTSNIAKLDVSSATTRAIINFERFGGGTFVAEKGSRDIGKMGGLSFRADAPVGARIIVVYAPEEDIDVKITMGGAAGQTHTVRDEVGGPPGEGGISVFKTTLKRNHEYLIKLGVHEGQGGGPRGGIAAFNSGLAQASTSGGAGGGIAAIYHKAKLIAVCGGGGGGAYDRAGKGGDGGGLQVVGERGTGALGGKGGQTYRQGSLPAGGMTQAGRTGPDDFDTTSPGGGRIGGCTTGSRYWRRLGFSPCQDIPGLTHFINAEGTVNTATAKIERGYKSGQGYRNNGGANRQAGAAAGGAGANGGSAAGASGPNGGGGGSGYASDEVELLSSSVMPTGTMLGGNDGVAFITFEVFRPDEDHVPIIPPRVIDEVAFTVNRNSSRENGITFVKSESQVYPNINLIPGQPNHLAFGAASVFLGPNEGRFVAQMVRGDKYDFWFATAPSPNGFELRLDMSDQYRTGTNSSKRIICDDKSFGFGGLTQLVGGDNDFNDLVITVDQGHFVLNKTGTVNSLNLQPSSSDLQYIYDVTV
jgi:hypothetical protein